VENPGQGAVGPLEIRGLKETWPFKEIPSWPVVVFHENSADKSISRAQQAMGTIEIRSKYKLQGSKNDYFSSKAHGLNIRKARFYSSLSLNLTRARWYCKDI
jgi:hypothetical protein